MAEEEGRVIPSIPDEIASARIGACFNEFTQKLIPSAFAITPSTATADDVIFIGGGKGGQLTLTANSSSSAAATETLFQLDTKASGGYDSAAVGVHASVEFHMEAANSESHERQNLSVVCYYALTGQRQELRKMDADELYPLMTPTFQRKYDAVANATDPDAYMEAYLDFVEWFGHGCVTTVHLAAGSAFRMTMNHTEDAATIRRKYGGSAALSGHYGGGFGGASVAADWAQDQKTANATTTLDVKVGNLPTDAPTADWVNSMLSNFIGITITELTAKASMIAAPTNFDPIRAPETPHGVPDQDKHRAPVKLDPDDPSVSKSLQDSLMTQDGFKGTWDEYVAAQKSLLDTLSPESVVKEATAKDGLT